jgi:hypothetical protein
MRNSLRLALIGLVALVAVGWFATNQQPPVVAPSASASSESSKPVTLVVDFGKDSGRPVLSYDLQGVTNGSTGWDLFTLANLHVQGTQQFPAGFVCRINGWPSEAAQDCADTPTYKEGHWAYYVTSLQLGGGWLLSGQGASAHTPECAGYEGWVWVAPGQESSPPRFKVQTRGCK